MEECNEQHSKQWLELMGAYQKFRTKLFHWAQESDAVKHRDLHMELSIPILQRELHQRLVLLNLLSGTEMWDEKAIELVFGELTEIALQEQDEIAAYARMALKKIKHQPERIQIAETVFLLAAAEENQAKPDCVLFHNGCMLLHDLGCKEQLERFISEYKDLITLASGLEETDFNELVESI